MNTLSLYYRNMLEKGRKVTFVSPGNCRRVAIRTLSSLSVCTGCTALRAMSNYLQPDLEQYDCGEPQMPDCTSSVIRLHSDLMPKLHGSTKTCPPWQFTYMFMHRMNLGSLQGWIWPTDDTCHQPLLPMSDFRDSTTLIPCDARDKRSPPRVLIAVTARGWRVSTGKVLFA